MQLYLIRHPPPAVAGGVCYGATDLPLAAAPAPTAARLRAVLPAAIPVVSSPLRRCLELARCLSPAPRVEARLAEIDFGDWEMQSWEAIGAAAVDAWAADPIGFTPPGGESPRRALQRALAAVGELVASGVPAACAVTHGGIIRMLAGHWQGLPEAQWAAIDVACGSVTAFDVAAAGPELRGQPLFLAP